MIETSVAVGEVGAGESGVNAAVRTRWGGARRSLAKGQQGLESA